MRTSTPCTATAPLFGDDTFGTVARPGDTQKYSVVEIIGAVFTQAPHFEPQHVEGYFLAASNISDLHEAIRVANEASLKEGRCTWVLANRLNDLVAYRVCPSDYSLGHHANAEVFELQA